MSETDDLVIEGEKKEEKEGTGLVSLKTGS